RRIRASHSDTLDRSNSGARYALVSTAGRLSARGVAGRNQFCFRHDRARIRENIFRRAPARISRCSFLIPGILFKTGHDSWIRFPSHALSLGETDRSLCWPNSICISFCEKGPMVESHHAFFGFHFWLSSVRHLQPSPFRQSPQGIAETD